MAKYHRNLNIGFISTRFAGTDGVSLETEKWEQIFELFGHKNYWFAGQIDRDSTRSLEVDEAFFNHTDNINLNKKIF